MDRGRTPVRSPTTSRRNEIYPRRVKFTRPSFKTDRIPRQPNNDLILQKQKRVLAQVRTVIEKRFGTGYKVETFGSVK